MDIAQVLIKNSEKCANKRALVFRDREINFVQLKEFSFKLASALKALGAQKGDRIAIMMPNCPEFVYAYLATFCLGAVGVPLDFMLKNDEVTSCLTHCGAKFLIVLPKKDLDLNVVKQAVSTLEHIVTLGADFPGVHEFYKILNLGSAQFLPNPVDDNAAALIMYTSGTTGKPKGILLQYKHLDGSPKAMEYFVDLNDKDTKLCAIPLSHIGGFIYIQNCIVYNISLILMERFNPFEFLELVSRYHVTCFHIVPPMYNAILTLKQIEKFDLSSLRWVVVFGAPSSPEILERFHKFCPNAKLLNGWGMTETCPPNTVTPFNSNNIASIGKPSPHCEIRIVNENDKVMDVGAVGELIIKSPYLMAEYYKDQELTKQTIRSGWLHTGDLGKYDADGFLYIVGRKKEMIKVGGQIVFAPEVEAAFYKNENVAEAAVIGIPDKMKGEALKAFIVLKEGSALKPEDLRYFAKDHLANFKVPSQIEICKNLPKNRTGKIDKELLKQDIPII